MTPTLKNLDKNLPTIWEPSQIETKLYQEWVNAGYFTAKTLSKKSPYSVVLPPPNITGNLHMGHALDHTLIDIITRRKRMQGFEVLWIPGTDHAGIAAQTVIEKQLSRKKISKEEIGRNLFIKKIINWKLGLSNSIYMQMCRLGDGVDWSRNRFTMDDKLSHTVRVIFKQLFDKGLIYQAERLVNWSPILGTAISDLEVSYKYIEGELISFRYGSLDDSQPHIVVTTTRLETMLGDTAIAVHPNDERYSSLIGTTLPHPFLNRHLKIVSDKHVDPKFGFGAVKITPAHDQNDFKIGLRNQLRMISIIDSKGCITNTGTEFDGMDRFEARTKVNELLAKQGRIVAEKRPYLHSVGHSTRSGEPIEPRLSLQWWVRVESLAKAAKKTVQNSKTIIYPSSFKKQWFTWLDNMHDWCISRQLWWGHRIPIWYGPNGETICVGPDETPPKGWKQDSDVLDTWFSSALWPFSTMGWPDTTKELTKFYPTNILITGYDIMFFWVARMMMFGTFVSKDSSITLKGTRKPQIPFKNVLLHGLIRDKHGVKMGKSKGNGVNPLEWIDTFGADALRFSLASNVSAGSDFSINKNDVLVSRNFVTKLFNATRFVLAQGIEHHSLPKISLLKDSEKWILGRLEQVFNEVEKLFETYKLNQVCDLLYHFVRDEFCDWYLELAKIQLRTSKEYAAYNIRLVLTYVLNKLLKLLHPVIPFITDILWKAINNNDSIVISKWPESSKIKMDNLALQNICSIQKLVTEIRRFRNNQNISNHIKLPARISEVKSSKLVEELPVIMTLTNLTKLNSNFKISASIEICLPMSTVIVDFNIPEEVNSTSEKEKLKKDLIKAQKDFIITASSLSNISFLNKAPNEIVENMVYRHEFSNKEIERISERLDILK